MCSVSWFSWHQPCPRTILEAHLLILQTVIARGPWILFRCPCKFDPKTIVEQSKENKLSCPISSSTSISNATCYSYCTSSQKKKTSAHIEYTINQHPSKKRMKKFCPFHLAEVQPRLRKGTEERHAGHQGGGAHAPGGHEPCRLRLGMRLMWNSPWSWRRKKRKQSNPYNGYPSILFLVSLGRGTPNSCSQCHGIAHPNVTLNEPLQFEGAEKMLRNFFLRKYCFVFWTEGRSYLCFLHACCT